MAVLMEQNILVVLPWFRAAYPPKASEVNVSVLTLYTKSINGNLVEHVVWACRRTLRTQHVAFILPVGPSKVNGE